MAYLTATPIDRRGDRHGCRVTYFMLTAFSIPNILRPTSSIQMVVKHSDFDACRTRTIICNCRFVDG